MADEIPIHEQVYSEPEDGQEPEYDVEAGERLAKWCHELLAHTATERKKLTREDRWTAEWDFIKGAQWDGPMPSYRRPIVINTWRRAYHVCQATQHGGRPTIKLVPQGGPIDPTQLKMWQDAMWAVLRNEFVMEERYPDASAWGLVGDGGFFKIGYGRWAEIEGEPEDVMITAPHPSKVYPDPDCSDATLMFAQHVLYREVLDLGIIASRYKEGWRATADEGVSVRWGADVPSWADIPNTEAGFTISPAGGWRTDTSFQRGRATVVEVWIDDSALETHMVDEVDRFEPDPTSPTGNRPVMKPVKRWKRRYPYGRLITCTKDVVLRDIPNPYGKALGWKMRWPFVYVPGALHPNTLWRPGLLSGHEETGRAINKSLSLLLENYIKVTNALVVADEQAMEDEDWDLLSLVPGGKYRKRPGSDFSVIFPQGLPPHAFQYPDYMIRKLDEAVGIHDPPIAPGQAVAAKTVAFLQQKGSFLLGIMAMLGDNALERLGQRIVGLIQDRYLPGREIPFFEGAEIAPQPMHKFNPLPPGIKLRVEATSAYAEQMLAGAAMAQAAEQAKQATRRR